MKSVCIFYLTYDIFLRKQKYLHQGIRLYFFAKQKKKEK